MARKRLPVSRPLERLRRRLDGWRGARGRRARLPESLWTAAVELAREGGVYKTAQALHLNYYTLKKRLAAGGVKDLSTGVPPAFFELVPSGAANSGRLSECTVEFDDGCGAKMRISLKGADTADLVALSRAFWGAGE